MHSLFIVNSFHAAQSALRVSDSGKNKNTRDDGSAFRQNKHPGDCPWICLLDGMQKNRMKYLQWLRYLTIPQILDVFTRFFFFLKFLKLFWDLITMWWKDLAHVTSPSPPQGLFHAISFSSPTQVPARWRWPCSFLSFCLCPSLSSFRRTRRDFLLFQTHSNLASFAAQL